jgi:acetyl esterase/lipase
MVTIRHPILFAIALLSASLPKLINADTRIACVGDSITAGSGLNDPRHESWPAQLAQLLGEQYSVKNYGVSGATLLKSGNKPYWQTNSFSAANAFQPNIVIIALGTNDSKSLNWKSHYKNFAKDASALTTHFKSLPSTPAIYICLPPPVFSKAYGINENNAKEIRRLLTQLANQQEFTIIDPVSKMRDKPELFRDGIHPLKSGAKVIAETVAEALKLPLEQSLSPKTENAQITTTKAEQIVDVWPKNKMPGSATDKAEADMPARSDGCQRITNVSHPTLTFFPVTKGNSARPVVIISPGGAYNYLVFDKEGTEIARWLNTNDINAIVLKYRTPKNRAGAQQDIQRAISLTRAQANQWNVDPNKIGVMGFSAGGHLSAVASTNADVRSYDPIDSIDHFSCRPDFAVLIYPAYLARKGQVSEELNLDSRMPPTLIIQTEDDKSCVADTKIFHNALTTAKIPHTFKLYPDGGHGYGLRSHKEVGEWPKVCLEWMRKNNI